MRCHICAEPSTGQCQSCWKFYCAKHGDVFCEKCKGEATAQGFDSQWLSAGMTLTAAGVAPDEQFPVSMPDLMRAEVLERVIPVAQARSHESTELSLISLESYTDGFILQYRIRGLQADDPSIAMGLMMFSMMPSAGFLAHDDRGTQYAGMPGNGGGGGESEWRGEVRFTPRIDPNAKELTIRVERIDWSAHGPGQKSRVELGPWEFVVPLT